MKTFRAPTAAWQARAKKLPADAAHWFAWWRGTAPLRDKRGLWLMIEWRSPAPADTAQMEELWSLWQKEAPKLW